MAEPEPADRAGILPRRQLLVMLVALLVDDVLFLLVLLVFDLLDECQAVAVRSVLVFLLVVGDQLGQHPRERVDLVTAERRAGGEVRLGIGEHPLEPEHEPKTDLPARRRSPAAGVDFRDCLVERPPARRSGREHLRRVLVVAQERLARPRLGAGCGGGERIVRLREGGRLLCGFLHVRSTSCVLQPWERWRARRRAPAAGVAPRSIPKNGPPEPA
jgi:hypothetical protein